MTSELSALEHLKTTYNLVSTLILIGSSSFLQVRRITKISRMSSNFGPIQQGIAELAALERLKKNPIYL